MKKKLFNTCCVVMTAVLSLFSFSCSNFFNNDNGSKDGKSYIKISVDENARTAYPKPTNEEFATYTLRGAVNGTEAESELGTWTTVGTTTAYTSLKAASIPVAVGTYHFTLYALKNGTTYKGSKTDVAIADKETTPLEFTLDFASVEVDPSAKGSVDIKLSYTSTQAKAVTAGLYKTDGTTAVEGFADEDLAITDSSVAYTKAEIPSGTYITVFKFYADAAKTQSIGSYWEYTYVAKDLTSTSTITVPSLEYLYKIVYEPNGGEIQDATHPGTYTRLSPATLPTNVTKNNYTFAGWYTSASFEDPSITTTDTLYDNVTLYAKWTANIYTLTYDKNGGTGTMDAQKYTYGGTALTLTANAFTPTQYKYIAWNTAADGSGTWYEDEATGVTLTEDTTLYAQYSVAVDHLAPCLVCLTQDKTTAITLLDATDSNQETIRAAFLADTTTASKVALTLLESTSLTKIIDNAYYDSTEHVGCTTLASIVIPENITSIGSYAFSDCSALASSIVIPNKVTEIKDGTFYYCQGLTSVTLPANLEKIGNSSFFYCNKLAAITIPATVTSIGAGSFRLCEALTITIPEENTSYNTLYSGKGIITEDGKTLVECIDYTSTTVTIPTTVETIGIYAFAGCDSLTTMTIPNSVEEIGSAAFGLCDIPATEIVIPASVMRLGCSVFGKNISDYKTSIRFEDTSSWYYKVLNPETDTADSLVYSGGEPQDFSTAADNYKYMAVSYDDVRNENEGYAYYYYYFYKAPCITSFSLMDANNTALSTDCVGVVDEAANTIKVTVPSGTVVTSLVPTFTIKSADGGTATATVGTTTQTSDTTSNDFTSGVTYTVTAADGNSKQDYTVTVGKPIVYAVGDILLSDGKKVDVANIGSITEEQAGKAVAVVAQTDSSKGIAVGLKQSSTKLAWAPKGTTGYTTNFTNIVCTPSVYGSGAAGTASSVMAANYPAFNYAVNYGTSNSLPTGYTDGWYMPSLAELCTVYKNMATIDTSIAAINDVASGSATALESRYYWSSSQYGSTYYLAWGVSFGSGGVGANSKHSASYVLVVRAF